MRLLKEHEVTFTIDCLEEHLSVRGNAMVSGDDAADREAEDEILADLNGGNQWAWCSVRVRAEWNGFRGEDYLGGCSYKSEADFKEEGGYFEDMKERALDELNKSIASIYDKMQPLISG